MIIRITVKPNAKRSDVITDTGSICVWLKSAPIDGKANEELIQLLAKYFHVPQKSIHIKRGASGRKKTVEINE
jgi:uncharacterized protein